MAAGIAGPLIRGLGARLRLLAFFDCGALDANATGDRSTLMILTPHTYKVIILCAYGGRKPDVQ